MTDKPQGFARMYPLFFKAGLPEERHEEFVEMINAFTTLMVVLINANEDVAPNYLTFAMVTPEEQRFELTVQKCEGKAPCEVIDELESEVAKLKKELAEYLEAAEELD